MAFALESAVKQCNIAGFQRLFFSTRTDTKKTYAGISILMLAKK
jgi:hypothetical protein